VPDAVPAWCRLDDLPFKLIKFYFVFLIVIQDAFGMAV
jgi:hypothetical protein